MQSDWYVIFMKAVSYLSKLISRDLVTLFPV